MSAKKKEKREKLESLKNNIYTMIFYEAPHKIEDTLRSMLEILGDREISIPGIGIIQIFSFIASLITSSPGSEIPGVPASETTATYNEKNEYTDEILKMYNKES